MYCIVFVGAYVANSVLTREIFDVFQNTFSCFSCNAQIIEQLAIWLMTFPCQSRGDLFAHISWRFLMKSLRQPSPPDKPNVFNHHQHSAIAISNWIISAVSGAFYVGRRSPGKAALSAFNYKNKVSIRSMSIGLSCKTFPIETPLLFVLSKILFTK